MKAAATAAVLGIAAVVAVVVTSREPAHHGTAPRPAAGTSPGSSTAPSPAERRPAAALVSPTPPASAERRSVAAGGVGILASAVRAQAVVAGIVSEVASVDLHGWRAELQVDRVLLGNVRLGDTVTVAWEELASGRQVRFENGHRVLVVLEALPTQSLWRKRFSAADRTRGVWVVAAAGEAFLPRPDGLTLDLLEHYLAMAPSARDGAPGARKLAELVRGAHPTVAREALVLLEAEPPSADLLGDDGTAALLAAARSPEREPTLRSAALRLAVRDRLPGTRETALALTDPGSPIRADAYRALAALPDGLPAERAESLLTDADPDLRAVGVEVASAATPRARFVALAHDPAPTVRLAAGRTLLGREGSGAIADVVGLLDDSDRAVRSGIAEAIGGRGDDAVAPLRAVADGGSEQAAFAAILGLSRAGPRGRETLASIGKTHANASVAAFARLALGEAPPQPY